jgi:hypothetical protein
VLVWSRLHGLVSLEIAGNFASMGIDPDQVFEAQLGTLTKLDISSAISSVASWPAAETNDPDSIACRASGSRRHLSGLRLYKPRV